MKSKLKSAVGKKKFDILINKSFKNNLKRLYCDVSYGDKHTCTEVIQMIKSQNSVESDSE